jgi:septal ring-binding cell division protein DamX
MVGAAGPVAGQAAQPSTQQAAGQAAPQPRSTSVANEERYTLQLEGANTLTVTQHFIRQGVYTGSMRWRLRRD